MLSDVMQQQLRVVTDAFAGSSLAPEQLVLQGLSDAQVQEQMYNLKSHKNQRPDQQMFRIPAHRTS